MLEKDLEMHFKKMFAVQESPGFLAQDLAEMIQSEFEHLQSKSLHPRNLT